MSWSKTKSREFSRYAVSISSTSRSNSVLLGNARDKSIFSMISGKIAALLAVFLIASIAFAGNIATAPEARADVLGFTEGLNNAFCSSPPQNFSVENKELRVPTTGKAGDSEPTAYEKYGMAGLRYSTFTGFYIDKDSIVADDNKGKGTSKGMIAITGGNGENKDGGSGLLGWYDAVPDDKKAVSPGMYNTQYECPIMSTRNINTSIASGIFEISKSVTWLSGQAYQISAEASSNIYVWFKEPIEKIVKALKDKLYFNFLIPMIMIAALWMAWVGLVKRRSTEFLSGLLWLVGSIVASVAFMSNPMFIPNQVNTVVSTVSQGGMSAITGAVNNGSDSLCAVKGNGSSFASDKKKDSTINGSTRKNIREIQCNLWYSFAYTPWTIGQFGKSPTDLITYEKSGDSRSFAKLVGQKVVSPQSGAAKELSQLNGATGAVTQVKFGNSVANEQSWALYFLDQRVNYTEKMPEEQKIEQVKNQFGVAANQLSLSQYNGSFKGDNASERITVASTALLAAIGSGLMIIIISVSIIVLDLGIIIMTIISPVFFLAALHPGAGRRIAMGWVESIVKMALKRIALSIFLAVMVAMFSIMIESSSSLGWMISMILIVAVAVGGLAYKKQVSEMFNGFSLGGQEMSGSNSLSSAADKAKKGAIGNGLAAVTGGRLGRNSTLGRAADQKRSKKEWDTRMGGGAGSSPKPKAGGDWDSIANEEAVENVLGRQGGAGSEPNESKDHEPIGQQGGAGSEPHGQQGESSSESNDKGGDESVPRPKSQPELEDDTEGGAGATPKTWKEQEQELDSFKNRSKKFGAAAVGVAGIAAGGVATGAGFVTKPVAKAAARGAKKVSSATAQKVIATRDAHARGRATRNIARQHKREGIDMPITPEMVTAKITQNKQKARNRRDVALAPVNAVVGVAKSGGQAVGNAGKAVGNAGKAVGSATAGAANEFSTGMKSMDEMFFKGRIGKAGNAVGSTVATVVPAAARVIPDKIREANYQRGENNAMKKVVAHERRVLDKEQVAAQKAMRKDIKSMPKGVIREVYAQNKYGADANGRGVADARPQARTRKPVVRRPKPNQPR